jgi:hypothetical protein
MEFVLLVLVVVVFAVLLNDKCADSLTERSELSVRPMEFFLPFS